MADKIATVKMTSLKEHTYDGIARPPGTVYDVDPQYVETVAYAGMAARLDVLQSAPKAEKAEKASAVSPMSTPEASASRPRRASKSPAKPARQSKKR